MGSIENALAGRNMPSREKIIVTWGDVRQYGVSANR